MDFISVENNVEVAEKNKSMQEFGEIFIDALPKHIRHLQISGRIVSDKTQTNALPTQFEGLAALQTVMHEVLFHPITCQAQAHAENTFKAFLGKEKVDAGLLKFFNGWNEMHKTTSLVSAKIIIRLASCVLSIPAAQQNGYLNTMVHMHEVVKDDFGLGHKGHDGMYSYMVAAFDALDWLENQYKVNECNEFSKFLYETGVAQHKSPMNSVEHNQSIINAMMVSIASELWNGREYNFIGQFIEEKLLSTNPALADNITNLRNAKGYVMGHAGEVENKHGLHALAAAQTFCRTRGLPFKVEQLKKIMLDYNSRVGSAFSALHRVLILAS